MTDIHLDDIQYVRYNAANSTPPEGPVATWVIEAEARGGRYDIIATYERHGRRLVVALVNFRVCWQFNSTVHWDYVADKLNLSRPDAQVMALIINDIHDVIARSAL